MKLRAAFYKPQEQLKKCCKGCGCFNGYIGMRKKLKRPSGSEMGMVHCVRNLPPIMDYRVAQTGYFASFIYPLIIYRHAQVLHCCIMSLQCALSNICV